MKQIIDIIKSRRTCRSFLPKQITDEELNTVLESGLYAPSGMGKQSPIFIVIQDEEIIKELSQINTAILGKGKDAFFGAPTLVVVLSSPEVIPSYQLDGMASVQNMLLTAESLGLGSACISRAKETFETEYGKALLRGLGIDESYIGVENVILGYRDGDNPPPPPRKENRIYKI